MSKYIRITNKLKHLILVIGGSTCFYCLFFRIVECAFSHLRFEIWAIILTCMLSRKYIGKNWDEVKSQWTVELWLNKIKRVNEMRQR